eukprot:gene22116-29175_t
MGSKYGDCTPDPGPATRGRHGRSHASRERIRSYKQSPKDTPNRPTSRQAGTQQCDMALTAPAESTVPDSGIDRPAGNGASPAGRILNSLLGVNSRGVSTSSSVLSDDISKTENSLSTEPARKFRQIDDKEMWHEAWMYEDKFGTESDPILVPSLEAERIIGVSTTEHPLNL